ncbi:serine hydrolase [Massilia sp. AB1]|uniref:serine hydrolase domain-containing protein n=1 Tax=Massilia sp. AB1 TaxID=2823371 RepID=UPI001B811AE4|nr:serine hydrolase domain-containing protein [Massilia sp. AB1]MBQ5940841.1 beta-lactamase family protein [Massilia sp. AB1]
MKWIAAFLVSLALGGCASAPAVSDDAVAALMRREQIQGLALAVIEDGKVVKLASYGKRNVERNLPLETGTIMYGASLTKSAFAYMVLQLVDEGRLDLDTPVTRLLPKPLPEYRNQRTDYAPLAGDERWRKLTPRILLTHSGGFANFSWLEPDEKIRIHFDPGSRYAYSGEGIYLLQYILEEGLGLDVAQEMQRRIFDRFGMANTSMRWRPDFAANLADGYTIDGKMEPHDERSKVSAAGSMDTTIADQARFWAAVQRGEGLSARMRAELVRPQLPIRSRSQFPTLVPEAGAPHEGIAAGLGLVSFQDRSGLGWFKGGHNDSTGNMVVCLEARRRCVVLLANDVRAERIFPELVRMVLGENDMPWRWEYGDKTPQR